MAKVDTELKEVIYFQIEKTIRMVREYTKLVFQEHGFEVTIEQSVILRKLYEEQGISQTELAEATANDPASITRTLDILVRKGFVERRRSKADRRIYEVYLTKAGEKLSKKMEPVILEIRSKGVGGMTEKEASSLKQLLGKIQTNFES